MPTGHQQRGEHEPLELVPGQRRIGQPVRLGESPMAYVRRVRLARVRDELLAGDPSTTWVTDVATRWGFFHQSRFAQQYRARFHELPSVTLHR